MAWLVPGARAAEKVTIDFVDAADWEKNRRFTMYVDFLDDAFNVIREVKDDKVTVLINGAEVPGKLEIKEFKDSNQFVAVGLMMGATRTFKPIGGGKDEQGNDLPATSDLFKYERLGFAQLVRGLTGASDKVAVWQYDEKNIKPLSPWKDSKGQIADIIEGAAFSELGDEDTALAPNLYKYIKDVVDKMAGEGDLPRRKILIMVSDGGDRRVSTPEQFDKVSPEIIEAAKEAGIKIYPIGIQRIQLDQLVYLSTLASKTDGVYRELIVDEDKVKETDIPDRLESIAAELSRQYVITFTPDPDTFEGLDEKAEIQLAIVNPQGNNKVGPVAYREKLTFKKPATNWVKIGIIAGSAVGGLFLLFGLGKLIKYVATRPKKEVAVAEDSGPTGPYKGKLSVTEGPHAGHEFYLVDDVITVGSMPGNSIELHGGGVSKRHAGIKIEDLRFELADFGSTNGTYVNGNKITKQFLKDGDLIKLGDTALKFTLK
jgi:hypothetical protein